MTVCVMLSGLVIFRGVLMCVLLLFSLNVTLDKSAIMIFYYPAQPLYFKSLYKGHTTVQALFRVYLICQYF